MANQAPTLVTIGCDGGALIEIELGHIERDHVQVRTRLRFEDQSIGGGSFHYGIDILQFTEALTKLHDQLSGSARFYDWDGLAVLCLTVTWPMRGRIAIGGQLVHWKFANEESSEDRFLPKSHFLGNGGIYVAFDRIMTDQSFLPPAIASLRRFLSESDISVRPAWD